FVPLGVAAECARSLGGVLSWLRVDRGRSRRVAWDRLPGSDVQRPSTGDCWVVRKGPTVGLTDAVRKPSAADGAGSAGPGLLHPDGLAPDQRRRPRQRTTQRRELPP